MVGAITMAQSMKAEKAENIPVLSGRLVINIIRVSLWIGFESPKFVLSSTFGTYIEYCNNIVYRPNRFSGTNLRNAGPNNTGSDIKCKELITSFSFFEGMGDNVKLLLLAVIRKMAWIKSREQACNFS